MKIIVRAFLIILSIALGGLFLYSAYTKVYTLESFESFQYTIVEYVKLPWIIAALAGRALIGLEAAFGLLIATHLFGNRKWVLKAALALMLIFSIYLIYLWVYAGDNINCGCFGDAIWMSPSTSLIKNACIILALLLLIKFHNGLKFNASNYITLVIISSGIVGLFFYYPLPYTKPQWLKKGRFQLDMSVFYAPDKVDSPKVDLRTGKYIIGFYSIRCPHCRMAAYKMHVMKERNPSLPLFMVLGGKDTSEIHEFWDKTKAQNIPYTRLPAQQFTDMIGFSWPVIYFVKNGWVEAQTNYVEMNQESIEEWLHKP